MKKEVTEETTDLPRITDELDTIWCYQVHLDTVVVKLINLVVIAIDCKGICKSN